MTSFSFFKYFDSFELDVNVVNFVYYGKTRLANVMCTTKFIFQKELILETISAQKRDFPDFVEGTTKRYKICHWSL